ncbi:unnamed protein product [Acanthoscelides obtectus]|uniref:Uncharacterized protein n=3 Tax=Acanthoscelides obtectus TaxID=200917 RepID=A0A9P0P2K6_ACAOB|nr:unnamed protein product [Acanthoscelides obtectus]CAK1639044.1 hypothetical protein AOBTE_LOCUS10971 [Acanthoscelides obtectus]
MKNTLASKKLQNCKETRCMGCATPSTYYPKATVVSNWKRRNDSSNVNSVLKHEYGKHSCYPAELEAKRNEAKKKTVELCNNCYCTQKGTIPMLSCRPKTCIAKEREEVSNLRTSPFLICDHEDKIDPSSSSLNNTLITTVNTDEEFDYTEQRKAYNRYRGEDDKPLDSAVMTDASEKNLEKSVTMIYGTNKPGTSQTSSYFTSQASSEDLKAFRNEHYFETHSSEKFEKEAPEHICTYQFKLDDSALLQPLNTDLYGKSRCIVCNVPMDQRSLEQQNSYYDHYSSDAKIRKAALIDKYGLVPRTVGITGNKMKIQLKCSANDFEKLRDAYKIIQRPKYCNTFALKQQKMIF